jgi:hypothetical protein
MSHNSLISAVPYTKKAKSMNKDVFSKWLIQGIEGFCFGSDKELYRLSFKSGRNYFGVRKLKRQKPNRWKINSVWWSERKLKEKIYLNPNPEIIVKLEDMPF